MKIRGKKANKVITKWNEMCSIKKGENIIKK
jgi:hypothetical protein